MSKKLVGVTGQEITQVAKPTAIHPFGSKILVEVLRPDEVLGTNLYVSKDTELDGAPQAYVIELGPQVPTESGVKVGQRILWTGKGTPVSDPRCDNQRVRALLEVHNIQAIVDE